MYTILRFMFYLKLQYINYSISIAARVVSTKNLNCYLKKHKNK